MIKLAAAILVSLCCACGMESGPSSVSLDKYSGELGGPEKESLFLAVTEEYLSNRKWQLGKTWFVDWGENEPSQEWLDELSSRGFNWTLERPANNNLADQKIVESSWEYENGLVRVTVKRHYDIYSTVTYKCLLLDGEWWVKYEESGLMITGCFQDEDE